MPELQLTGIVKQAPCGCRRHAERIPYPVDAEFHVGHRILTGVVRDISIDRSRRPERIGIAVLHYNELPTGHPVLCLLSQATERLPQQFDVVFRWTRRFGDNGYLSGGLLI